MLKGLSLPKIDTGPFFGGKVLGSKRGSPNNWGEWLTKHFPDYVEAGFAPHHEEFWEWAWNIERGKRPESFIAIWPRGGAKSMSAEMAVVMLGALRKRRYVLYVSGTQDQADDHVQTIADMIESSAIGKQYPELASPKLGKHGNQRGWKRNRLRTASGFTVDAIGLDKQSRGKKLEEDRPDLICLDDVDDESDTELTTTKKIRVITRKLIPAGSSDLAILGAQNLVHPDSIFSQLADGTASFLKNRHVSGPIPALRNAEYDEETEDILAGDPVWEGQNLETCKEMASDMGLPAFRIECQQEVQELAGRIWRPEWWDGKNRYDINDRRLSNRARARWIFWDTANKKKETNAFTAGVAGELLPDYRLLIRKVVRDRKTFDELPEFITEESVPFVRDKKLWGVVIEDAASGTQAIQVLGTSGDTRIRSLITPSPAVASKEENWEAASLWCRRGMVLLPHPSDDAPWLWDFEDEVFNVLIRKFKDQADAFAGLINHVEREYGAFSKRWDELQKRESA